MNLNALKMVPLAFLFAACGGIITPPVEKGVTDLDIKNFQSDFMFSYELEGGSGDGRILAGFRELRPFGNPGKTRVTVPQTGNFAQLTSGPTVLTDFPEPGQTTVFTASAEPGNTASLRIYRIEATTTFPAQDLRASYLESYLVRDGGLDGGSPELYSLEHPDGIWDNNDPIVDPEGTQNQKHRLSQQLTLRDGTVRDELIVSMTGAGGSYFKGFDPAGDLTFSPLFSPAPGEVWNKSGTSKDNILYSSVVVYDVAPAVSYDYWFWSGAVNKRILGIRYYTEYLEGDDYVTSTLLYEKVLDAVSTSKANFGKVLTEVYIGSLNQTLAENVLRQEVRYPGHTLDAGYPTPAGKAARTTRMGSRVVNIQGRQDFFLEQIDTELAELTGFDDTTIYAPSGNVEEILASDSSAEIMDKTVIENPDGTTVKTVGSGTGDVAILYRSIEVGAPFLPLAEGTDLPPPAVSGGLALDPPDGVINFSGNEGFLVENVAGVYPQGFPAVLPQAVSVEAWVYINSHINFGGILHLGTEANFSDEGYSLQFWDNKGTLAWLVSGSAGKYDRVQANQKLNTKKWYHIVAVWETNGTTGLQRIYVDGVQRASSTKISNSLAGMNPSSEGKPLVIGSQLVDAQTLPGYYGFNGKINGVRVYQKALTLTEAQTLYNQGRSLTASW